MDNTLLTSLYITNTNNNNNVGKPLELEEVACSLGERHPVFQHALPRDLSSLYKTIN